MRLFVGLDVPPDLAVELARAVPEPFPGLRPVPPEDIHLTLHFLGAIDRSAVERVLADVRAEAFAIDVSGLGMFRFRDGRRILWAGIVDSAPLTALHRAAGDALAGIGYRPESRPYRPHLTLARVDRRGRRRRLDGFDPASAARPLGRFEVNEFVLYDSASNGTLQGYTRLRRFALDR